MRTEDLRNLLRTQPFQPFTVHLPEGRAVEVWNPEFALLSPEGRRLIVYARNGEFDLIDVMLVSSVHAGPPSPPVGANGTSDGSPAGGQP